MNLAQNPQESIAAPDFGAAAGVIGGVLPLRRIPDAGNAQAIQDCLHRTLQGEKVHIRAIGTKREHLWLVSEAVWPCEVGAAQLVELGGLVSVVVVPGQNLQHRGQRGRPHDGSVLSQGIENPQRIAQGRVRGQMDLVVIRGADEGIGDDLVIARRAAQSADGILRLLDGGEAAAGIHAGGEGAWNPVVAVETGHLLRNIGVVLHIGTPRGDVYLIAVQLKA